MASPSHDQKSLKYIKSSGCFGFPKFLQANLTASRQRRVPFHEPNTFFNNLRSSNLWTNFDTSWREIFSLTRLGNSRRQTSKQALLWSTKRANKNGLSVYKGLMNVLHFFCLPKKVCLKEENVKKRFSNLTFHIGLFRKLKLF